MSSKGWYTKQDVIQDLVEVTGGKCLDDFDEHCVVGDTPPPAMRTYEDNEEVLRFYGGKEAMVFENDKVDMSDLIGITQMLRMVDNYNEGPNCFSTSNEKHLKSQTTETESESVSKSKLNPEVNEFVPQKCVSNSSIGTESKVSKQELKMAKDDIVANVKLPVKTNCCYTVKTKIRDNRIDISRLLSNELKEMRDQLKTKICDTSKVKCVKLKRERNLAIATLMKLNCQPPANEEKKPILISPEYFKTNPANKNILTEQNDVNTASNSNTDFTEDNLNASSDAEIIRKEIAASVEKVTRWLHNSEPDKISEQNDRDIRELTTNVTEIGIIPVKNYTKGPSSLHLGTVTFKRKTHNNSQTMSPISLQSGNSKTKSETFVPSVYASELTEKYIQQSKKKQEAQTDIWKSLEIQLKNQDEKIKKKTSS